MSETIIYAIIILAYLIVLILIGFITGRRTKSVEDFYIGGRQIGPWVTALSFVAAYFSSVVIIGGGGYGYMFGMATLWIGAINVLLGCAASMIGGFSTALIWMIAGSPFGIHGFIPGIIVGFILMVSVSFFTPAFSQEHIDRIWG